MSAQPPLREGGCLVQNDDSNELTSLVAGLADTASVETFRREIEGFRQHPLIQPHLNDVVIEMGLN